MNDLSLLDNLSLISVLVAIIAGSMLSLFFFKGLQYSTERIGRGEASVAFILLSFVTRLTVVCVGFYWLGTNDWRTMTTMLVAFILTRHWLLRPLRKNVLAKPGS